MRLLALWILVRVIATLIASSLALAASIPRDSATSQCDVCWSVGTTTVETSPSAKTAWNRFELGGRTKVSMEAGSARVLSDDSVAARDSMWLDGEF